MRTWETRFFSSNEFNSSKSDVFCVCVCVETNDDDDRWTALQFKIRLTWTNEWSSRREKKRNEYKWHFRYQPNDLNEMIVVNINLTWTSRLGQSTMHAINRFSKRWQEIEHRIFHRTNGNQPTHLSCAMMLIYYSRKSFVSQWKSLRIWHVRHAQNGFHSTTRISWS